MKPGPHFKGPRLLPSLRWSFPPPSARFITLSWVNSTRALLHFPPLFHCTERELALTGSGWCPDGGMMGRGNGKCYPHSLPSRGPVCAVSPYTASTACPLRWRRFSVFVFSVHSAPFLALSSLGSAASAYNGVVLAEPDLTLPGCLCVELSNCGKEKRGLRFAVWRLLGLFAHRSEGYSGWEQGEETKGGEWKWENIIHKRETEVRLTGCLKSSCRRGLSFI